VVLVEEQLTIDRETFKALSSDTRLDILKALRERKKTITELAESLNLSKSTVHEHLTMLIKSGLVKRIDSKNKWVYYSLTWKGMGLFQNNLKKIVVLFSSALTFLLAGTYELLKFVFERSPMLTREGSQKLFSPEIFSTFKVVHLSVGPVLIFVSIFLFLLLKRIRR